VAAVSSTFLFGIVPPDALRAVVAARCYHCHCRMASDRYFGQVRLRALAVGCLSQLGGHILHSSAQEPAA
jgi:hypothetical protein